MHAIVYWQPEVDPGTVILTTETPVSGQRPISFPELDQGATRRSPDGLSLRLGRDAGSLRLLLIDEARAGAPLAALVPLDDIGLDRIEALSRLWRVVHDRPPIPDTRLTAQRRRRLRQMLQAIDGYLSGATYREIAAALYGAERVASEPWKTSSLRDSTISLVRDGRDLIDGGYRNLLRHRRRR